MEWEKQEHNEALYLDGFYISYNPGNYSIQAFASDNGMNGSETALCKDGKYLILNGDFREDYEKLVEQGYEECLKFYNNKKDSFNSSWTSGK